MAVAPESTHRVESIAEVAALPAFETPVALLAQTTLSHRDWKDVLDATKERFPDMWVPGRSDLCFATTNRQTALMNIAPRCDAMVVVGSANSSNTPPSAAGPRGRMPAGVPHQRRRRTARRAVGNRRGHRWGVGTRGPRRGGHRPSGTGERGRGGPHDRRGRVLSAAATCATCCWLSTRSPRSHSAATPSTVRVSTTASSRRATSSAPWPEPRVATALRGRSRLTVWRAATGRPPRPRPASR